MFYLFLYWKSNIYLGIISFRLSYVYVILKGENCSAHQESGILAILSFISWVCWYLRKFTLQIIELVFQYKRNLREFEVGISLKGKNSLCESVKKYFYNFLQNACSEILIFNMSIIYYPTIKRKWIENIFHAYGFHWILSNHVECGSHNSNNVEAILYSLWNKFNLGSI